MSCTSDASARNDGLLAAAWNGRTGSLPRWCSALFSKLSRLINVSSEVIQGKQCVLVSSRVELNPSHPPRPKPGCCSHPRHPLLLCGLQLLHRRLCRRHLCPQLVHLRLQVVDQRADWFEQCAAAMCQQAAQSLFGQMLSQKARMSSAWTQLEYRRRSRTCTSGAATLSILFGGL